MLLIAVISIWGIIGYKIINGLSPDEPQANIQEFEATFKPEAINKVKSFSIQKVERDPFLGTLASNNKKKKASTLKPNMQKAIKNSPLITYAGLVKKQDASNQVFVVNINNNQYLLKKGQIADSVKLIRGNTKEIVVSYNNKLQTIKRY